MYWEFRAFDKHLSEICGAYEPFAFSWVITIFVFLPYFITIGMIAVSFYQKELYLKLVGIFLTFDFVLNTALYYAIADTSAPSECGDEERGAVPSCAVEQITVFVVMMSGLFSVWKRQEASVFKIALLSLATPVTVFSRVMTGLNTPEQALFGALVGLLEGCTFLFFTYCVLWPRFFCVEDWVFVSKYIKLEQTMCEDVSGRVYRGKCNAVPKGNE